VTFVLHHKNKAKEDEASRESKEAQNHHDESKDLVALKSGKKS
jgi:hypothetical protein